MLYGIGVNRFDVGVAFGVGSAGSDDQAHSSFLTEDQMALGALKQDDRLTGIRRA